MSFEKLVTEIYDELLALKVIDIHTHLIGGHLSARGLHDVMLYHMIISDLYSAGCPSGSRLTQYPGWVDKKEAESRIIEAIPYFTHTTNTHLSWGLRIILNDLYGWDKPITTDNWRELDDMIRERADDRTWQREIFKRANIVRSGTELARRGDGSDDHILAFALEWVFFTRCQWGEYDTALYELERVWGKSPSSPMAIGSAGRPKVDREIKTIDDVHAAVNHCLKVIPYNQLGSMATHVSTDLDLSPVTDKQMVEALSRRSIAGERERSIYASYVNEAFLSGLEKQPKKIVFQFSYGAEPLPYETASRLTMKSISDVAGMISRHPGIHFQCFLSSHHANQSMCTLVRELPNLSLAGFWWHNFYPETIRQVFEERLDMVPLNKQIGFFSDAYCIEWSYGKRVLVMKQMAQVLAKKIQQGQYTRNDAVEIAQKIMLDTPRVLLGMNPGFLKKIKKEKTWGLKKK
jgi:glucuronate isomerase